MIEYYEEYYDELETKKWIHVIPIAFILSVIPLIVYLKVNPLNEEMFKFWNGQKENLDFFSYYKLIWLMISTIVLSIIYILKVYRMRHKYINKSLYYLPLLIYFVLLIVSTISSKYKGIAIWGYSDRYEGVIAWTCYILICFFTMNFVRNRKHIKILIISLIFGAIILSFIGLMQYLGFDIWKTNLGKSIIIPSKYNSIKNSINFSLGDNIIYSTIYHYNYVGSYISMIFPLTLTYLILTKNIKYKIALSVINLILLVIWLGSGARSSFIGVFISLVILLIILIKNKKIKVKNLVILLAVFIGLSIVLNIVSKGSLYTRINSLINDIVNTNQEVKEEEKIPLKDIKYGDNYITVEMYNDILNVRIKDNFIELSNKNQEAINYTYNKQTGQLEIEDERYKAYKISLASLNEKIIFTIEKERIKLFFQIDGSKIYLIDGKGNPLSTDKVEKWGFEGKERIGSSRGYIWSRTIPLLKNVIFKGYGPDTFAAYFPQQDFEGKYYAYYGDMWHLIDKPHNLYLQIAINTGVISLIAILVMFLAYLLNSIRIYLKCDFNNFTNISGLAIMLAIIGYLGAGFFNDSVVSVAPVFWVLLGMGIAINGMVKKGMKSKEKPTLS